MNKPGSLFLSNDENTHHLMTKQYAEEGKLYFDSPYNEDVDYANNLHPRSMITFEDRIVTFAFLGIMIHYGPAYTLLGENIYLIALPLLLATVLALYCIVSLYRKESSTTLLITALSTPAALAFIYYLGKPLYNNAITASFFLFFVYFMLKFQKEKKILDVYLAALFACTTIWLRYNFVLFVGLFLLIHFLSNSKLWKDRLILSRHSFLLVLFALFAFVLPLLIVNNATYKSPSSYGYDLFYKIVPSTENKDATTGSKIFSLLVPFSESFNDDLFTEGDIFSQEKYEQRFTTNTKVSLILISPILFLFFLISLFRWKQSRKYLAYLIIPVYFILYTATGNTYLSGSELLTLQKSIVRYWIAIVLVAVIFMVVRLREQFSYQKGATLLLLAGVLVFSVHAVATDINDDLRIVNKQMEKRELYLPYLNESTYLLSANEDKFFAETKQITWWCASNGCEANLQTDKLAKTLKNLLAHGEVIYALKTSQLNDNIIGKLEAEGLSFEKVKDDLYRVGVTEK